MQGARPSHELEKLAEAGGAGRYASNIERDVLRQLNAKAPETQAGTVTLYKNIHTLTYRVPIIINCPGLMKYDHIVDRRNY